MHWLIGVGLLGQVAFGFLLDEIAPRGTTARAAVMNLHKSIGIVLGVLIVVRIVWRLRHQPPAWPAFMTPGQRRAARLGHGALYACMLVMPVSAYVASNFSKYGVKLFGWAVPPWGPELPAVYAVFNTLHVAAAWLFTVLVAGHVLIAIRHAVVDRYDVFGRISPWRPRPASKDSS